MFLVPVKDIEIPSSSLCYGCAFINKGFPFYNSIMIELIGGFFVVYIYYSTVVDKRGSPDFYPLMMALVIFFFNLIFGIEMSIMINPSRYLASALTNLNFKNIEIYPLSCCFGALWAAFMFEKFILKNQPKEKAEKLTE